MILGLFQLLTVVDSAPIRINQLGYRPELPKVAVVCALARLEGSRRPTPFTVEDSRGRAVLRGDGRRDKPFAACAETWRLDFTRLTTAGTYRIRAGASVSPP